MLNRVSQPDFDSFIQWLVNHQIIDKNNAERLTHAKQSTGQAVDVIAMELGIFSDKILCIHLAEFYNINAFSKDEIAADEVAIGQYFPDVKVLISNAAILTAHDPAHENENNIEHDADSQIHLVVADPFDIEFVSALEFQTGHRVELSIATRADIINVLKESDTQQLSPIEGIALESDKPITSLNNGQMNFASDLERLNSLAMDAPVVKSVHEIVHLAVVTGATDIHIEPEEHHLSVRLRVDGMLVPHKQLSMDMHAGILSRIKILSRLNIAERRLPQDGRMRMSIRGVHVDFRISIVPTITGEMIVLRILNTQRVNLEFGSLGFEEDDIAKLNSLLSHSHGILLVTGPTNSGKSTSLYTALSTFKANQQKIITVEDPVEMQLPGINQIQINSDLGLDFPTALRSVLRQDPDILMIGEIRDQESARIAIRAAITGHLVLATLHTNSAVGAITRLRDIGIEDYLIAATLRGVMSQRLLRTHCDQCSKLSKIEAETCSNCQGSRYSGRTVVCEILLCDEAIGNLISNQEAEQKILSQSISNGMRTMSDCALQLVKFGKTSREEVARVTSLEI